ncbi:dihydrodipicolinate synthase family protein [Mucilaginibacter sp. PAMB04274]|uniref:dihydrodipicolinate synthase family protein n=1 Tax=Mucilaginibacter sp. PAMB04274 TaxID=3138568 RepID=UPI0031F67A45
MRLTAETLKGNWATLLLPVNTDDSINYTLLAEEIDQLIAAQVDGIYSNGSAGEFHNQTEAEFDKINELLASKCRMAGMPFQIGASHPSPIISKQRLQRSVALLPDAIQVILPDWIVANQQEQVSFLQGMSHAAAGIPLVLYNPPHAKMVLPPQAYAGFKDLVPSLIGIKVLSGDVQWVNDMKRYGKHLSVFVPGHMLATGFANGIASGAYSNVACINAKAAQQWWDDMQTDINSALDLEFRIQQFFKECIVPYQQQRFSNPALDKFLSAVGGYINVGTRLRWPYHFISEDEVLTIRKRAQALIPEFFTTKH